MLQSYLFLPRQSIYLVSFSSVFAGHYRRFCVACVQHTSLSLSFPYALLSFLSYSMPTLSHASRFCSNHASILLSSIHSFLGSFSVSWFFISRFTHTNQTDWYIRSSRSPSLPCLLLPLPYPSHLYRTFSKPHITSQHTTLTIAPPFSYRFSLFSYVPCASFSISHPIYRNIVRVAADNKVKYSISTPPTVLCYTIHFITT